MNRLVGGISTGAWIYVEHGRLLRPEQIRLIVQIVTRSDKQLEFGSHAYLMYGKECKINIDAKSYFIIEGTVDIG